VVRRCLAKLLHDPFTGRVLGRIEVEDLSTANRRDSSLGDLKSELQQLTMDARGAPGGVLARHGLDGPSKIEGRYRSTDLAFETESASSRKGNLSDASSTTVAGPTIRSGLDHFGHSRRSVAQNSQSEWRKRARLVCRFKTINCCLKANLKPRSCRDRTKLLSLVNSANNSQNMNSSYTKTST
jgi:hypothetical protein